MPVNKQQSNEETLKQWQRFVTDTIALPEVIAFQQAEHKIMNHERIHYLREQIKREQKALVNAQHYLKSNAVAVHEQTIRDLETELEMIPLWHQYQELKTEINTLIQEIIYCVEQKVSETAKQ